GRYGQRPRTSTREMRTLSPVEVRRFLDAVRRDRFEALYTLALSTGIQEGELLGLWWQDSDFVRRTLQVHMNVQETLGLTLPRINARDSQVSAAASATARLAGLPGPQHVLGRVLVAVEHQATGGADVGAHTQALRDARPTPATVLGGVLRRDGHHRTPRVCCV